MIWNRRNSQEDEYMTFEQILFEEKSKPNALAKRDSAMQLGEGINEPGKRKGWYKDPSRNNAPVFLYYRNQKHKHTIQEGQGRKTNWDTENFKLAKANVLHDAKKQESLTDSAPARVEIE